MAEPADDDSDDAIPECRNCFFWHGELPAASCRRYPPVYVPMASDNPVDWWQFPTTMEDDWCGEFKHYNSDEPDTPPRVSPDTTSPPLPIPPNASTP